jgi:hypothetical protein
MRVLIKRSAERGTHTKLSYPSFRRGNPRTNDYSQNIHRLPAPVLEVWLTALRFDIDSEGVGAAWIWRLLTRVTNRLSIHHGLVTT